MRRSVARRAAVLFLALAPLLTSGCDTQENKFVPPPPPPVSVSRPEVRPVTDYLELTGNTQSIDQVQLQARVEGFLTAIHFKDGDYVKKGDPLFTIEQDVYKAKVLQAEGQLAAAQAQLQRALQEYTRQQALLKQNATATSEVEKWKAQRDEAEATIVEARANLELARINLGYCRVAAPFDGRMDRHLVTPGNLVGAGKPTELAVITRLDPIYAYFTLNERDLVQLMADARAKREGYKSTVIPVFAAMEGEDGYSKEGRLDFVSSSLDAGTGTILMRAVFDNPMGSAAAPRLLPGMFLRLRLPLGVRDKALLVPERALGVDQAGRYLLVVNDRDIVEQRPVKTGPIVDGMRVIDSGLAPDDWVVVSGIQRARPGAKVQPMRPESGSPAAPK
jgi:RND family efflux transporter MFP subunit